MTKIKKCFIYLSKKQQPKYKTYYRLVKVQHLWLKLSVWDGFDAFFFYKV